MNTDRRNRILLVDDDKLILKVLGDFLTFKGFDVTVAESGEEGLEQITSLSPDIILLDISMPGIGGIGFLTRIMTSHGALQYPVLVFTARTTTEEYFRGIPVDGFIAKPCDKNQLVDTIHEILEKHRKATLKTLLIGEDDPVIAERLGKGLRAAGFVVDEAATGPEVLEKATVCLPDAILMKQILTGMNGDAVAALLKVMSRTQSIPVILYDASGVARKQDEMERLRFAMGIVKYLATDDIDDLLHAVNEVVPPPPKGASTNI